MTEKRFTLVYQSEDAWEHEWSIKDNQEKGDWVIIQGNGKEIVECLNNLHEKNEELSKDNLKALALLGDVRALLRMNDPERAIQKINKFEKELFK